MPETDSDYLEALWREAFTPPERKPVWQWAEEHVENIPYSPIPGRFQASNSPMLKEVMQEMVNPRTRLISIIASVQSSKSTAIEVALCYIVANLPGPTLWLDQNDDDAKDQAEGRLRKLFDCCPPVKRLYPGDRYKLRNTTIQFANGMTLWVAGAYNKSNLQRRSIRWLIGDETWRWPQGHMAEAEARTTAFGCWASAYSAHRAALLAMTPTPSTPRPTRGNGSSHARIAATCSRTHGIVSSGIKIARMRMGMLIFASCGHPQSCAA